MKKAFVSTAVAALLITATFSATAQQDTSPPPQMDGLMGHGQPSHGEGMPPPHGPGFAVINDLEQLRRLYAMTGHESEIISVYHDVLNKTQDPMLRHFIYESLAREQLKPANPDQAIATLRTSLAEDIVEANRAPHGEHAGADVPHASSQTQ